jgi:hypothetical protein
MTTNVFKRGLFSARSRCSRSSRGMLFPTLKRGATQLSKPFVKRKPFVGDVSGEYLITTGYIQSLAHGRSSNDEAQARRNGKRSVA